MGMLPNMSTTAHIAAHRCQRLQVRQVILVLACHLPDGLSLAKHAYVLHDNHLRIVLMTVLPSLCQ